MPTHRITDNDIDRWLADGIISAEQRQAIVQDLERRAPEDERLSVTTLLYYSGGLLILVAYAIFLGFQWGQLNQGGRIAIAGASFAFFAVVSQVLLRTKEYRLPGELLQVVAVAVVPLLTFAVLNAIDLWPNEPRYYEPLVAEHAYTQDLTWGRMGLAAPTILVAALGFWQSRSPFVLVAALAGAISLALDASLQVQGDFEAYEWHAGQGLIIAALGAVSLGAGIRVRGETERDYSFWLSLVGLSALAAGLGALAFPSDAAAGWGIVWLITALLLLAVSVPLQERLFAAAGLLAVFAYLGKLVFDVFESANAALAMIVLGILVLGAGILYQRQTERMAAGSSSQDERTRRRLY